MRALLIRAAEILSLVAVVPLIAAHRLRLISYASAGQLLSLMPGAVGLLLRRSWYSATLAACGRGLTVEFGTVIHKAGSRIGDHCYFGEFNRIGLVRLGSDFLSSNHVSIMSGRRQHGTERRDVPVRLQPTSYSCVSIGDDVWVGASAVVAADLPSHAVVAAGAVVMSGCAEWEILGGVPARVIGVRP
jgi:virginiamycin A acetyltransferase